MWCRERLASNLKCALSSSEQEFAMGVEQAVEQTNEPMLKLAKVSKHFGGLAAVQYLDIEVLAKEIISII
jgi:hypothetical protein